MSSFFNTNDRNANDSLEQNKSKQIFLYIYKIPLDSSQYILTHQGLIYIVVKAINIVISINFGDGTTLTHNYLTTNPSYHLLLPIAIKRPKHHNHVSKLCLTHQLPSVKSTRFIRFCYGYARKSKLWLNLNLCTPLDSIPLAKFVILIILSYFMVSLICSLK